jgi:protein-S-isoprenylcysteine O-methyltransferase Ste14
METETLFRIILPALVIGFAAHRGYYVRKYSRQENTLKKREEGTASRLAGSLGLIGFVAAIAYVVDPTWLAWAGLPFPTWLRWFAVALALLGFGLLHWSQKALGTNWSDTPRMMTGQNLITSGPYRFIRHPIYTAFLLILGSTLFISANWLIGATWIGMTVLEVASRIGFEEAIMIEYFGDQYRDYMKETGQVFPKVL